MGTGPKALKEQYASFLELERAGAAVFETLARAEMVKGKKGEWVHVGAVAAEGDDAHGALQVQLNLIIEQAIVVSPALLLVRPTVEVGWRPESDVSAEVALLERKAIPVGSLKTGFRDLQEEAKDGTIPTPKQTMRKKNKGEK